MGVVFFTLNQKVMHVPVATDKLSSQRVTSQLLGGKKVLNILVCSGVDEVNFHN